MMDREKNIEYFKYIMQSVRRPGVELLMDYLEKSDFYTAPASAKYHGSYEGGLLEHSINVFKRLSLKKCSDIFWKDTLKETDYESIVIVSLLHDLCKINLYLPEKRQTEDKEEKHTVYMYNDQEPYGHGEKSVMIIEDFMKLTQEERYAIRWHMGPYSGQQDWNTLGKAIEKYHLILALFESDMEAAHVMEVRK